MFISPPSGLGCDLEFGFSSFELENPLICVYNKNFQPSGDGQAARSLSDCCGRSKQRRQARGAPSRSSIHTFSARAPSHRAVFSRFPLSTLYTRFNSQSGGVCTVRRRDGSLFIFAYICLYVFTFVKKMILRDFTTF